MIKINLVREARAVRGAAATPGAAPAVEGASGVNNILLVGLLVIGLIASAAYWFVVNRELEAKKEQVVQREAEAQQLEAIIREVEQFEARKDSLERRIALINDLKKRQRGPVQIMDRISRDLPDLVWLDRMSLAGSEISIEGRALNPNAAANFFANIKNDVLFDEPDLSDLTQQRSGTVDVYQFKMKFNFAYPESEKADAAAQSNESADAAPEV